MTALTRMLEAYNEYRERGLGKADAITLARDDAEIDGDSDRALNCMIELFR